jgi:hypothetical protein
MRRLARYGLLTGLRRYLLARPAEKRKPNFKGWLDPQVRYRLPKIEDVK